MHAQSSHHWTIPHKPDGRGREDNHVDTALLPAVKNELVYHPSAEEWIRK